VLTSAARATVAARSAALVPSSSCHIQVDQPKASNRGTLKIQFLKDSSLQG